MSRARTFADLATASEAGSLSNRNMLHNGNFAVHQRGETISITAGQSGYTMDRWLVDSVGTDQLVYEISQSDDVPTELGEGFSLKYQTKTVESATVAADEIVRIIQYVEAKNCQRLGYGTSGTKTTTISFYVKSSIAGTFSFIIYADDGADIIGSTFVINSADTWERKTLTFVGNNLATIANDTGIGVYIQWNIAAGSNYTGGDNSTWKTYAANLLAAGHTQSTHITVDESTFQIAGCQWEVGEVATPFEHIDFANNLQQCQRYFFAPKAKGDATSAYFGQGLYYSSSQMQVYISHPVQMRAAPSVTVSDGSNHFGMFRESAGDYVDTLPLNSASDTLTGLYNTDDASGNAGHSGGVLANNQNDSFIYLRAEL